MQTSSLRFLEDLEYHCDRGHTTDGDSKSNTSFRAVCCAGASVLPAPPCGCTPVVCEEVPVLWNTLPLPNGTQETPFVVVTTHQFAHANMDFDFLADDSP